MQSSSFRLLIPMPIKLPILLKFPAIAMTLIAALLSPPPAHAQIFTLAVIEWVEVEEAQPALAYSIGEPSEVSASESGSGVDATLAEYGPFRVVDQFTAEMHGVVTSAAPAQFAAMRAAFPLIRELRMVECPGSEDDEANLALARMVRAARIDTSVPAGGSVRSGAVELFLAGVRRKADSRAEFAVHSWRDDTGREAADLAEADPIHREYLDFYQDMGMAEDTARSFYALTNSVPFDGALYLAPLQLAQMGLLDVT